MLDVIIVEKNIHIKTKNFYYFHDNKREKINLKINKCPYYENNNGILSDYNYLGNRKFEVVFKCSLTSSSSECGEKFTEIAEPKSGITKKLVRRYS